MQRNQDKSFLELLPKGRLLAALTLLALLIAVVYFQRHSGSVMENLKGFVSPAPSPKTEPPRVRLDPALAPPPPAGKAP